MYSDKALIMMCTYNGERYIREQLDSILQQSHGNWQLIISDDGSSDATVDIIGEYMVRDSRIHLISNALDQHGPYYNFWQLIHYVRNNDVYTADYYFFSDQDDCWKEDKLAAMIDFVSSQGNRPVMSYSDLTVIDESGQIITASVNESVDISLTVPVNLFFIQNAVYGCTTCMNHRFFSSVPLLPLDTPQLGIVSHDSYFGKYAVLNGCLEYNDQQTILYRRHSSTVTSPEYTYTPRVYLRKLFEIRNKIASQHARTYAQSLVFIDQIERIEGDQPLLRRVRRVIECGGIKGCIEAKRLGIVRPTISKTVLFYLIIFFKLYRRQLDLYLDA